MNDETRKALDEIFAAKSSEIVPLGASMYFGARDDCAAHYLGQFQIAGTTLNKLRQLYEDAISADDAAKKDKELNAENAKIINDSDNRVAAAEAAFEAAKAAGDASRKKIQDKLIAAKEVEDKSGDE